MRPIVIAVLCLMLAGCYTDQQQQVAACQISLENRENDPLVADKQKVCMQAHGFQFKEEDCPDDLQLPQQDHLKAMAMSQGIDPKNTDKFDEWVGAQVGAYQSRQANEAACYEPLGWGGRQVLKMERLLGRTSN